VVCCAARAVGPPPYSVLFTINYYCITAVTTTATRKTTMTTTTTVSTTIPTAVDS
jgi:hypothetical protein